MSQEWKLVPVELIERLTATPIGSWELRKGHWDAVSELRTLLAAAPVPPDVGEPDVVAYLCNAGTTLMMADQRKEAIWNAGHPLIELQDHRAHVTRLQAAADGNYRQAIEAAHERDKVNAHRAELIAERDALKASRERLHKWIREERLKSMALQSELAKARELLRELWHCSSNGYKSKIDKALNHQCAPAAHVHEFKAEGAGKLVCQTCGKYAPAAKGEEYPSAEIAAEAAAGVYDIDFPGSDEEQQEGPAAKDGA